MPELDQSDMDALAAAAAAACSEEEYRDVANAALLAAKVLLQRAHDAEAVVLVLEGTLRAIAESAKNVVTR